jgi:multiple sugar transport system permease protein
LPVVIGLNTASLIWVWLYNDQVGVFDGLLQGLRLIHMPIIWLESPNGALLGVLVMIVWKTSGLTMLLLLGGMQAIPEELYESARVDGGGRLAQLRYITLPLLRRTFALALTLSVIGSFLAFDQFFIMTHGGPQQSTLTTVFWIYSNAFTYFKLGYGSAMSVVLLLILVAVSALQLYLLRDDTQV